MYEKTTLENPVNFRDLAGIPCAGNKTVAKNRLLRCGAITGLNRDEKNILTEQFELQSIIDLRGAEECQNDPDDRFDAVAYRHIDIMENILENAPNKAFFVNLTEDTEAARQAMLMTYELMITNATATDRYSKMVELLLEQESGATAFHCYAGKDRTGLAAAIILTILGAEPSHILDDYLKTNVQRKQANKSILQHLKSKGFSSAKLDAVQIGLTVDASYLEHAYKTTKNLYGSFANYITAGLGVTAGMAKDMQKLYLV